MKNSVSLQTILMYFVTCCVVMPLKADDAHAVGDYDNDQVLTFADVDIITTFGALGPDGIPVVGDHGVEYDLDFNGFVDEQDVFLLISWIPVVPSTPPPPPNAEQNVTINFCEAGDYTGDGIVDCADWDYQIDCHDEAVGTPPAPLTLGYTHGDANGDGVIDGADFRVLRANWHTGPANAPAIPANVAN